MKNIEQCLLVFDEPILENKGGPVGSEILGDHGGDGEAGHGRVRWGAVSRQET